MIQRFVQAQVSDLMDYLPAIVLLLSAVGSANAAIPENSACVDNPPLESLSPVDRSAIESALRIHSSSLCATDACEFRLRKISDGNTLVRLRAARYAPTLQQCVTVYMGHTGVVLDPSGKVVDMWPYCHLMEQEMKHDSSFRPDREFTMCRKLGMSSNIDYNFAVETPDNTPVDATVYNSMIAAQGHDHYCGTGNCDKAPELVSGYAPTYPPGLLVAGVTGDATVIFTVDEGGSVVETSIESSTRPEFADAVLSAIRTWQFKPAMLRGKPVRFRSRQQFPFELL